MTADASLHPTAKAAPPANIEAEQALLGVVMYDNAAVERVGDLIRPDHFHEPFHARLWERLTLLIGRNQLAEPILLAQHFKDDPAFEELGGIRYLADIYDRAPPPRYAPDYAREVHDLAQRRALIRISDDIAGSVQDISVPANEHIEAAEQALFGLAEKGQAQGGFQNLATGLATALEAASAAYQRDGGLSGISTGLIDLDRKLGGLHKSDLIIIAARPSMGKSGLALNIAYSVAKAYAYEAMPDGSHRTINGGRVGFFSLEMSHEQLSMRLLAEVSGVPSDKIRRGEISAIEYGQLRDAAVLIQDAPLFTDESGGLSLAKLTARARRMKRTGGLDLIVVDYLQLITLDGRRKADNRVQEVTEITGGLKALAKELNVPVIALAQLSRNVENREDKKPQLADLRESGSIEQDADVVMFIYREAYYLSRTEPAPDHHSYPAWLDKMNAAQGVAEIIIGKQRHGPIGVVRLHYKDELTKFSNLAQERPDGHRSYGVD